MQQEILRGEKVKTIHEELETKRELWHEDRAHAPNKHDADARIPQQGHSY